MRSRAPSRPIFGPSGTRAGRTARGEREDHRVQEGDVAVAITREPIPERRLAFLDLQQPVLVDAIALDRGEQQLAVREAIAETVGDQAAELVAAAAHLARDDDQ